MIDIHTHILPGIDDGSKSVRESIRMLSQEAEMGVTEVVLTPHFYSSQNSIPHFLERRQRSWERLELCLTERLPKLRLGAEVQYFEGICSVDNLEALRIDGTELLLVEMPFARWTDRMIRDILELNDRDGIQVLLAHVERYFAFQSKDPLPMLLEEGILLQSNLSFFTRWQTRLKAVSMLKQGMIHALGSDCHNMIHRPPAWDTLPKKIRDLGARMDLLTSFESHPWEDALLEL